MTEKQLFDGKVWLESMAFPEVLSCLIVDDQRFDRKRLHRLCGQLDGTVHLVEADTLESMGTALEAHVFDLILLDYNLPDGNGLQGIDAIRFSTKNRQAAVIMITGDEQSETAIESLKRGCNDYIVKDALTAESLRHATINALQKSRLRHGLETQENQRARMESVLARFSQECAHEIKPMLSRMIRQVRGLAGHDLTSKDRHLEDVSKIEHSCLRLWEFLEDLEAYEGSDISGAAFPDKIMLATPSAALPKEKATSTPDATQLPFGARHIQPGPRPTSSIKPKTRPSLFGRSQTS